ncbi:MAG: hypothetical protein P8X57_11975 [Cyclobacteriaceae bacterium]
MTVVLFGCDKARSPSQSLTDEQLVKSACGSCHVLPEPELLPKEYWKNVLPHMGLRLGIKSVEPDPFTTFSMEETQRIIAANVFPEEQLIDDSLWHRINKYYLTEAPDILFPLI